MSTHILLILVASNGLLLGHPHPLPSCRLPSCNRRQPANGSSTASLLTPRFSFFYQQSWGLRLGCVSFKLDRLNNFLLCRKNGKEFAELSCRPPSSQHYQRTCRGAHILETKTSMIFSQKQSDMRSERTMLATSTTSSMKKRHIHNVFDSQSMHFFLGNHRLDRLFQNPRHWCVDELSDTTL